MLIKCKKLYEKYDRRLRIFNLESLALRRTIYDLSIIYKIVKSFTHFDPNYFFNFKTRPSRNKHNIQICISKKSHKTEQWVFNRTINLWNTLPSQIVNASNPKIFWQLTRAYLIQLQSNNTPFLCY